MTLSIHVLLAFTLCLSCDGAISAKLSLPLAPTAAFAPPLGIGAVLFRPKVKVVKSNGEEDRLVDAGRFFVDAFWTGKVGGTEKLTTNQAATLERQQIAEFKKRYKTRSLPSGKLPGQYAGRLSDSRAELVLCLNANDECIGCAGVEVDKIKKMDGYDGAFVGPVMSNLAVSRKYRRMGLAEELVKATENIARKEWGYDTCYLYVEKRNTPAIKLYKKLGYSTLWEDPSATTLLPTDDGRVANGKTTIVCMKKNVGAGLFANFFGQ
ncbi:hypothetical protein ACHAWX_003046 [Stephanocyclus meneghinianus]